MSATFRVRLENGASIRRPIVFLMMLFMVCAISLTAVAATKFYYEPCTWIAANSSSGTTLTASTAEYLDNCDRLDAWSMRYLNLQSVIVTTYDSATDATKDSFTRQGLHIYWTKHRANDGGWSPTYILYP